MLQRNIDTSKPVTLYLSGLAALMVISVLLANLGGLGLSSWVDLSWARWVGTGFFAAAFAAGATTLRRHIARTRAPWKVPQSQVSIWFIATMVCGLIGIFASH